MTILDEEKNRFFTFLDTILKQGSKEAKGEIPEKSLEKGGVKNMADEKKLEDLEKRLQELSDSFAKDKKVLEDDHKASLVEVEKKLSEAHAKEMEDANKKLEETNKKLAEKELDLRKEKVEVTCNSLVEKGFWPSVVEKAKKVMLADAENSFGNIKLDEKDMSVSDILVDMLEAIPTEVRVNLEELSHINKNTDPNKKYLSEKEVEQYAKDNKMTYQDACSVLAKDGKIEL